MPTVVKTCHHLQCLHSLSDDYLFHLWFYHALNQPMWKLHKISSLIPRLLCRGGGKRAWYTLFKVPLVICILLRYTKIMVDFCLPVQNLYCVVILLVGHIWAVLKSYLLITFSTCLYCSPNQPIWKIQPLCPPALTVCLCVGMCAL